MGQGFYAFSSSLYPEHQMESLMPWSKRAVQSQYHALLAVPNCRQKTVENAYKKNYSFNPGTEREPLLCFIIRAMNNMATAAPMTWKDLLIL